MRKKEIILYLFFGGLTFFVSIAAFALFYAVMGINELLANVFSWIIAVLFAFFTNRIWVFSAPAGSAKEFIKQMSAFFGGRTATLVIEEFILSVFISWLNCPGMTIKVIAQAIVIVLNYIISKSLVFKKQANG